MTCDRVFEADVAEAAGGGEARCPKCHRVHDVVPVRLAEAPPWYRRRAAAGAAAALAVAGACLLVYVLRAGRGDGRKDAARNAAIAPSPAGEVAALVARAGRCDGAGTLGRGSPGNAEAGARAVAALFRCLAETGILAVRDYESPADLGDRPPTDPAELAARLLSQTATVTSLEAALLVLRIARSEGLDARVVRVERWPGADVPADLSGTFGHYAVEIGPPRADGAAGTVIDPSLAAGIAGGPIDASPVPDDVAAGILDAYRALRAGLPREDAREPDRSAAKQYIDRARKAASKAAPVRLAHALTAGLEDPRTAFVEADALRESASHSEKIGLAELCIGLGRIPEAERLLADVEAVYPVWYKAPLVRAQIALIRASVLAKSELALARPAALPEGMADEIGRQIRALGVPEGRRPDDLFDEAASAIGRAERLGGATLASRLRQVHAVALAEYRIASGDIAAARDMLDRAAGEYPTSLAIALPRAALALATGDEAGAREALSAAATPDRPLEKLLDAARQAADRLRPLLQAIEASPGGPFDLSGPGAATGTEPTLRMPGLLRDRTGRSGLGQGLQLRY